MHTLDRPWHIVALTAEQPEPDSQWFDAAGRILQHNMQQETRRMIVVSLASDAKASIDAVYERLRDLMNQLASRLQKADADMYRVVDNAKLVTLQAPASLLSIDVQASGQALRAVLASLPPHTTPIVPGGIAVDSEGNLSRITPGNGNYTATTFARALDAPTITLWGSHEGILSADPAFVPEAYTLPHLSFHEAAELGYHVQPVLHPKTLIPLRGQDIELRIKSLARPEAAGTFITRTRPDDDALAQAVTAQPGKALLVIAGLGMMGIPGVSARAFEALAAVGINIVLLSQSANEQSVGICIDLADKDRGLEALRKQFAQAIARGDIDTIYSLDPVGIVTVVDDHMRYRTGLTGTMFSTLGRSGINVLTIADGGSETNISAVVAGEDLRAAVQALHEAFCFGRRRAHVCLLGVGTIGKHLLELMEKQSQPWLDRLNLNICLVGVANSRKMAWDTNGIPFAGAVHRLHEEGTPANLPTLIEHLSNSRLDRLIVIDATASDEVARWYPDLLNNNIAVVTPNKRANTLSLDFYNALQRAARDQQVPYFYETTVGAGLPIVSTLRDLIRSGDEILRIEGILSGTMAFIFNQVAAGLPFAAALKTAYDRGFTEPDPRDDLSGEDVARKMLILAREMGLPLERADITMESWLPEEIFALSKDEFLARMASLLSNWTPPGALEGSSLTAPRFHYIGRIENGAIHIGLQHVEADSHFASLTGTDNMVVFTTRRYLEQPLIVRGPGAGPAVTAGGILSDVIRAAELVT